MALSIKDPETDRLVRELAAATGEPITLAVKRAVAERLELTRSRALNSHPDTIGSIIARGRNRALLDNRNANEILGYDDLGLPS